MIIESKETFVTADDNLEELKICTHWPEGTTCGVKTTFTNIADLYYDDYPRKFKLKEGNKVLFIKDLDDVLEFMENEERYGGGYEWHFDKYKEIGTTKIKNFTDKDYLEEGLEDIHLDIDHIVADYELDAIIFAHTTFVKHAFDYLYIERKGWLDFVDVVAKYQCRCATLASKFDADLIFVTNPKIIEKIERTADETSLVNKRHEYHWLIRNRICPKPGSYKAVRGPLNVDEILYNGFEDCLHHEAISVDTPYAPAIKTDENGRCYCNICGAEFREPTIHGELSFSEMINVIDLKIMRTSPLDDDIKDLIKCKIRLLRESYQYHHYFEEEVEEEDEEEDE